MTVQTICDRCGMEYTWAGVTVGDRVYCCMGCANGGPCTCPNGLTEGTVVTRGGGTTVVSDGGAVVAGDRVVANDDVVIVE